MDNNNSSLDEAVENIVRHQIWYQLETAVTNAQCAKQYRDRVRRINKWYDIVLIFIPVAGTIASYWNLEYALAATLLTIICTLVKNLIPSIRQSNQDLVEIDKLAVFYENYLTDCVSIYTRLFASSITPSEAQKELYPLERSAGEKSVALNSLIWSIKKINKSVETKAKDNLFRRFGITPPTNE